MRQTVDGEVMLCRSWWSWSWPERVLRALEAKAAGTSEPRRKGKLVVFDEELSVNAVSSGGMRFEVPA